MNAEVKELHLLRQFREAHASKFEGCEASFLFPWKSQVLAPGGEKFFLISMRVPSHHSLPEAVSLMHSASVREKIQQKHRLWNIVKKVVLVILCDWVAGGF